MQSGPYFLYMGTVTANRFVELITGYAKFRGPVGDVGCHLWVYLFRIMRTLDVFLVECVGRVRLRGIVML
ncbi:hypothetical protein ACPOL_5554 [Acidisarcina polymorpha]|uniref:Uncharacterized protein n=1 Tax=Acidisarcina polymorpha TaxID=2211140 RepID=A0A2Z5G6D7_9BACT|nr:hypothetical protein ACPOL_5554 [Acidisarcina polymorpha]